MKRDNQDLSWSLRVVGAFMLATSVVGGLLVTFVLPANHYLSGVLLLMLGLLLVAGLMTVVVGLLVAYRGVIARSIALPAIILSRLFGRG